MANLVACLDSTRRRRVGDAHFRSTRSPLSFLSKHPNHTINVVHRITQAIICHTEPVSSRNAGQVQISLIQGIPALPSGSNVTRERETIVSTYLVERYWPGVTSERLLEALHNARRTMDQMSGEGIRVRHYTSILIPSEEVVFSVYEGPSQTAVRQLNQRVGIPVSRIVDAIAVTED